MDINIIVIYYARHCRDARVSSAMEDWRVCKGTRDLHNIILTLGNNHRWGEGRAIAFTRSIALIIATSHQ
jgi:hypothetical protein